MIDRIITTPHRRSHHPAKPDPLNIIEVDEEDEDIAKTKIDNQSNDELMRDLTSISLPTTKKEVIIFLMKYSHVHSVLRLVECCGCI